MTTQTVPDRLLFLRRQVNAFRAQVDIAQARVDALSVGHPMHRAPGATISLNAARDDLDGKKQALRNAERLLTLGEELWNDQGRSPPQHPPVTRR